MPNGLDRPTKRRYLPAISKKKSLDRIHKIILLPVAQNPTGQHPQQPRRNSIIDVDRKQQVERYHQQS